MYVCMYVCMYVFMCVQMRQHVRCYCDEKGVCRPVDDVAEVRQPENFGLRRKHQSEALDQ